MPATITFPFSTETAFLHLGAWIILHIPEYGYKPTSILEALFPFWNPLQYAPIGQSSIIQWLINYKPVVKLSIWIG